ncbi:MAG: hypothetical protein QOC56_1972 [Alphaproteobacteria bacterium]|jgi:hypothetical protein|nr:hypothetical protein [Alphaproteobacteria bacterium]MEA2938468.1 hypothetical protein [Alphaproteobacteria bacterium]
MDAFKIYLLIVLIGAITAAFHSAGHRKEPQQRT